MSFSTSVHSLAASVRVVSFDVFDTVITRNVYRPQDLFSRVPAELAAAGQGELLARLPCGYRGARLAAETAARGALAGCEEVTLPGILEELARQHGLPAGAAQALAASEIRLELASVSGIRSTADLIAQLRRQGVRIAFISDMYLPEQVIREMLLQVGVLSPGDRLYVSGSLGKKKSTGSLFRLVLDDLQLRGSEILHLGDYLWSDVLVPRYRHGIAAVHFRSAGQNAYERAWGEGCSCLLCSSLAGAGRAARLMLPPKGGPAGSVLAEIGCNLLGPLLAAFVHWTLQQAQQRGVRRLYFLSRDGEILLQVARQLAQRHGYPIELSYLHLSRTAVFPALLAGGCDSARTGWLGEDNVRLTLRIVADRLKLDHGLLGRELERCGVKSSGPDACLGTGTVEQILQALAADPRLREIVTGAGRKAYLELEGYLGRQGLFDQVPFSLVDLGWHGSMQDALAACFAGRFGASGLSGFYFGLDRRGSAGNTKSGFLFTPDDPPPFSRYQHMFRVLMEVLCSAGHGMVSGYRGDGAGGFVPEFKEMEHPGNVELISEIRDGISVFLQLFHVPDWIDDVLHLRTQALEVLKRQFLFPSQEQAAALGELRFSADQAGHCVHRVAPAFTPASALRYLFMRSYAERSTISSWFFASWVRSGALSRLILLPVVVLFRFLHRSPGSIRRRLARSAARGKGACKLLVKLLSRR